MARDMRDAFKPLPSQGRPVPFDDVGGSAARSPENERLRAAADAAFYAMCAHRDSPDDETFQDAIDALGVALSK
jgi:hypothetical protein